MPVGPGRACGPAGPSPPAYGRRGGRDRRNLVELLSKRCRVRGSAARPGGELPSRTRLERDLTRNAALVRQRGVLGVYGLLNTGAEAGRTCAVW
jgi:hypothetical protein